MASTVRVSAAGVSRTRRGGFLPWLVVLTLAGLVLRIGVCWELAGEKGGLNSVWMPPSSTDLHTYMRLGRLMAEGAYEGVFYYQPFYYAVFLPAIYLIAGFSVPAVIAAQVLLGTATVWLAGLTGARLFGRLAGWLAAGFTAVSSPLLLYTPYHQNETLQTFNLTLFFYLVLRGSADWRLWRWLAAGAMAGVAILTRGNVWLLVPAALLVLVVSGRRHGKGWLSGVGVLLFLATALAVQVPFIWHNSRTLGVLSGPSTAAGAVLALGNSTEAPAGGREPGLNAGPMEYPEAFTAMMARSEAGVSVSRQLWEFFLSEPAAFLELQLRKFLLFWNNGELPNNVSLYSEGKASVVLSWLLVGRSGVVIPLAVAGLLMGLPRLWRRRDCGLWWLYGCIFSFVIAVIVFYNLSRFRAPVVPLMAVAAGGFVAMLRRDWRRREGRRRRLGGDLVGLLFGVWLCWSGYDFYRYGLESSVHRWIRPDGIELIRADGSRCRFDYGPRTFGGWRPWTLTPGMRLEKQFARLGNGECGQLIWTVLSTGPGELLVSVNGAAPELRQLKRGANRLEFAASAGEGGWVVVDVLKARNGMLSLLDMQRDYGRSRRDGIPEAGEWIMRWVYEPPGCKSQGKELYYKNTDR